jgi:FMN phosphatase YigB (HAD superfamily)
MARAAFAQAPAPKAVLFDLDDTLFDHRRSARAALTEVHRVHGQGTDLDAFEREHTVSLEVMHVEVLAGRIGLDDARRERFRRVFTALGIAPSGADRDRHQQSPRRAARQAGVLRPGAVRRRADRL